MRANRRSASSPMGLVPSFVSSSKFLRAWAAQAALMRPGYIRAVYTVKMGDAVHVLHAFQKKSKSGIATPQPDVELIEKRLKAVLARHKTSGR